jgi:uncharacterized protein (DUF1800 family)
MGRRAPRWIGAITALALAACGVRSPDAQTGAPPSATDAARFLTQASFGADDRSIAQVRAAGYASWVDQQLIAPQTGSHLADLNARQAFLLAQPNPSQLQANDFYWTFWKHAASDQDQLRQRVKFALSEIFVISLNDTNIDVRGAGSYYDMLGANAFGNFRTLLEQVTLHPMMGVYLTWLGNQKEDPATGRHPDENYAREVMQLMTIGLYQLNPDGTQRLDGQGRPIPTYTADDISGLAKVFTGYSYYSPTPSNNTFAGRNLTADARIRAMIAYPSFHSTTAKTFLGTTIPASATPDPAGDLKIALDALFNHPNVGPFIGRQLIQRLVTSNPSPDYVRRVADVFANNGRGVRGDMGAVVKAVLTDPEARTATTAAGANYGKLREPVVRMTNWMRAFGAASTSGEWQIGTTSANTSLGQSALTSPSVFNFFRPGYSPPNTRVGGQGLTAPEFQIVDEVSVAGYLNTMQTTIDAGIGNTVAGARDVRAAYTTELALAREPDALVDRVNLLLMGGQMSPALKSRVVEVVRGVPIPGGTATQAQINTALLNRTKLAIYMSMASSEYLVQR